MTKFFIHQIPRLALRTVTGRESLPETSNPKLLAQSNPDTVEVTGKPQSSMIHFASF